MPSSFASSFSPIVEAMIAAAPRRVVDVGPGWGKYGLAAREYLPGLEQLTAIEVTEGRMRTQDCLYDAIYTMDARRMSPGFWGDYDLALMIDIIEHMTVPEGHELLDAVTGSGCQVLVSTPAAWMEQHSDTNPYENHVSLWGWEEFKGYPIVDDRSTPDAVIYLLGDPR
jgi:hypothetical protein